MDNKQEDNTGDYSKKSQAEKPMRESNERQIFSFLWSWEQT